MEDLQNDMISLFNQEYEDFIVYANKLYRPLGQFHTTLGLGISTTCSYQHIIHDQSIHLLQYFVMDGLEYCAQIDDFTAYNFYGHTFMHNTSYCAGVDCNNRVWICIVKNKPFIGFSAGWGEGTLKSS